MAAPPTEHRRRHERFAFRSGAGEHSGCGRRPHHPRARRATARACARLRRSRLQQQLHLLHGRGSRRTLRDQLRDDGRPRPVGPGAEPRRRGGLLHLGRAHHARRAAVVRRDGSNHGLSAHQRHDQRPSPGSCPVRDAAGEGGGEPLLRLDPRSDETAPRWVDEDAGELRPDGGRARLGDQAEALRRRASHLHGNHPAQPPPHARHLPVPAVARRGSGGLQRDAGQRAGEHVLRAESSPATATSPPRS